MDTNQFEKITEPRVTVSRFDLVSQFVFVLFIGIALGYIWRESSYEYNEQLKHQTLQEESK
jgi:hypothetical protein